MAVELTDKNFEASLKENQVVVVDFWAEWCGPCRMVSPIIDEMANEFEGRALVSKLDVDTNPDTSIQFGVRNIPTVLFFKDGELVDRQVGAAPKGVYVSKLEALLS